MHAVQDSLLDTAHNVAAGHAASMLVCLVPGLHMCAGDSELGSPGERGSAVSAGARVHHTRSGNLRVGIGSSPRSVAAAAAAAAAASAAAKAAQAESAITPGGGLSPTPSADLDAAGVASTDRPSNTQVSPLRSTVEDYSRIRAAPK
jgi:hypothetical protein